jgi:hypothetical protein
MPPAFTQSFLATAGLEVLNEVPLTAATAIVLKSFN